MSSRGPSRKSASGRTDSPVPGSGATGLGMQVGADSPWPSASSVGWVVAVGLGFLALYWVFLRPYQVTPHRSLVAARIAREHQETMEARRARAAHARRSGTPPSAAAGSEAQAGAGGGSVSGAGAAAAAAAASSASTGGSGYASRARRSRTVTMVLNSVLRFDAASRAVSFAHGDGGDETAMHCLETDYPSSLYCIYVCRTDDEERAVMAFMEKNFPGLLPRTLCAGTEVGVVSMVRQIEPDFHVDHDLARITNLHQFVHGFLCLSAAPQALSSQVGAPMRVRTAASLADGMQRELI